MLENLTKQTSIFISNLLERYPSVELRDLYKFLYHAFHGADHAVTDYAKAVAWFDREWAEISPDDNLPLLEDAYIDGVTPVIYRINLARAKRNGMNPTGINSEFMRTAEAFPGGFKYSRGELHDQFIRCWGTLPELSRAVIKTFSPDEYHDLTLLAEKTDWPAMHHSEAFRKLYNPHYRLVLDPGNLK